jgi:hypothetical protein
MVRQLFVKPNVFDVKIMNRADEWKGENFSLYDFYV